MDIKMKQGFAEESSYRRCLSVLNMIYLLGLFVVFDLFIK